MLAEGMSATRRALDFAAVSHQGHARQRNEDYCFVAPEHGLAIVADGVGGQGDGAWASRRAVELFVQNMEALACSSASEPAILEIIQAVHAQMCAENPTRQDRPSGTTIAGIWAPQGSRGPMTVFNVGDSSIFHSSKGKMAKLSRDHSLYQLWLDGGSVGREPAKRLITQALGISEQLTPHIATFRLSPEDTVLLCTDGLSGVMAVERIEAFLAGVTSSKNACDILLQDVLAGAAPDNVTLSVCHF
jgi:serine/threonine protein phosphatase PrpC